MSVKELLLGFVLQGALIGVAVLSLCGDAIIEWGYYLAVAILFAFNCGIRLVLGNANKDGEATDWGSIGDYCIGSFLAAALSLVIYWA